MHLECLHSLVHYKFDYHKVVLQGFHLGVLLKLFSFDVLRSCVGAEKNKVQSQV